MNTSLIRKLIYIVIALIIIGAAIFTYWFYFMRSPATTVPPTNNGNNGFNPFGTSNPPITPVHNGNNGTPTTTPITGKQPLLRLLSATPVGGYGASTTASTTIIRWVDRGRGNIYEANGSSSLISIISNTLVPRIYESWWNKNADVFAAQYLNNSNDSITTVLTSIIRNPRMATSSTASIAQISSSTASNQLTETAYQLKGKAVTGTLE